MNVNLPDVSLPDVSLPDVELPSLDDLPFDPDVVVDRAKGGLRWVLARVPGRSTGRPTWHYVLAAVGLTAVAYVVVRAVRRQRDDVDRNDRSHLRSAA